MKVMKYKGYEILDKMNVPVSGATVIEDEYGSISGDEFNDFLERCKSEVEKLKNRGFNVTDISYSFSPFYYGEDDERVELCQIICREETDMEAQVRINDEKARIDHLEEVYDKVKQNTVNYDELAKTDEEYCRWRYHMQILKKYGAKTMSFEKWKISEK